MSRLAGLWQHITGRPRLRRWRSVLFGDRIPAARACGRWRSRRWAAFVALLAERPTRSAPAWLGWLFGVAHFTLSNNWIAEAFTHQAEMPAALGWAAVPLLSLLSRSLSRRSPTLGARALAGRGLTAGVRVRLRRLLDDLRAARANGVHRLRVEPVRR
jgi:apolipoprotein N-acyltransferase